MIVFLEKNIDGVMWETRNVALINGNLNNKKKNYYTALRYYECLILAIVCYIFYVIDFIKDKEICLIVVINILWPLSLVVWEVLVTKRINSVDKEKQYWIEQWNALKNENDN